MIGQVYVWAKKIHRLNMWAVIALGVVMMTTGLLMRYPLMLVAFPVVPEISVRALHSQVSIYFVAALLVMMITGLLMYFVPKLRPKPVNPVASTSNKSL